MKVKKMSAKIMSKVISKVPAMPKKKGIAYSIKTKKVVKKKK